jgi:hypothetical protein
MHTLEGMQSVALQQLGVSYPQLVDYSSKQYTATLVGSIDDPQAVHDHSDQPDIGSSRHSRAGNMGLYYYIVSSLLALLLG